MPKYLDPQGVSYLWSKIKNLTRNRLVYYSRTTQGWNSDVSRIAEENALYIYTDYKTIEQNGETVLIPGLKYGDGKTFLIDLPFLNDAAVEQDLLDHINNKVIHVSIDDRQFWDNKLNLNLELQNENLILNRE